MALLHPVLTLLLALTLGLGTLQTGHVKITASLLGTMVICTSGGAELVYINKDGEPVSAPHVCPDCIAQSVSAGVPDPCGATWHPDSSDVIATPSAVRSLSAIFTTPSARSPPA